MEKKNNKPATMKDVAKLAGVSLGTVSKVFNGIPVGSEYKAKVEAAAKELGYQVNIYARGLRANKTYTIALILPDLINPFFATMANYCCQILYKKGYRTIVATTTYDLKQEQECVDMVQQNKVDGIIAITYNPGLEVKDDLPFVIIDRKFHNNVPCISSDNFTGGQLAANVLYDNGCRNILFTGISSHVPGEADKRALGFESKCLELDCKYTLHKVYDEDGIESILEYIGNHISNGEFEFDGIFCNTDYVAINVLEKLKERGIQVPEQVQVIGYDGVKPFSSDNYYCSTIRQPIDKMAEAAVDTLLTPDAKSSALVCLPVDYCYGGTTRR